METAAATCYASKLFHRNTEILELTTKRTEEQSLHDVLFDLSRTVLRQHGSLARDNFSGFVPVRVSLLKQKYTWGVGDPTDLYLMIAFCWSSLSGDCTDYGLIIDGATLSAVMRPATEDSNSGSYKEIFLEICRNCSAVLCCRMAPLQKAQVQMTALSLYLVAALKLIWLAFLSFVT